MRAMSLKIKIYAGNINVINNDMEKVALRFILWSLGALALLYVIFLANMVGNIVERRGLEAQARSLSSEVSSLELTYLSMSSGIDLPLSYSMGFKETKASFATRKSLGMDGNSSLGTTKILQNEL